MNTTTNPTGGPPPGTTGTKGDPNRPLPSPRPLDDGGKGPHYTPWLVVRYAAGDDGSRSLAPGTVFWESPDVWTMGSMGINQPVAGEATQVFARVTNLGMSDAIGATIQWVWANPSIAINPGTVHPIGILTGQTIPAQNSLIFQSPTDWTPVVENNGHECLIAQAFVPVFDPLTNPDDPVDDRHVGQKNEQLITLDQGESFHFIVEANNNARQAEQVIVEVRRGVIPLNLQTRFGRPGLLPAQLLDPTVLLPFSLTAAPVTPVQPTATGVRAVATPVPPVATVPPPVVTTVPPVGITVPPVGITVPPVATRANCLGPALAATTQQLKPGEVQKIALAGQLPPTALPGEVHVIRISQRVGQVVVGGYTLYVTLKSQKPR